MNPRKIADSLPRWSGSFLVLSASVVVLPGCYGTKTLRQPITVEEIASDVGEIRSSQAQIRDDVQSMEAQLGDQAETIRALQAESHYLYEELEQKLAAIDAKLAEVLGRDTGYTGSESYWSGAAPTREVGTPDWSGAAASGTTDRGEGVGDSGALGGGDERSTSGDPSTSNTRENLNDAEGTNGSPSMSDREYVADSTSGTDGQSKRVYDQAYLDLTRGNYSLAILGFKEFLRRVPESDISDNAQYWVGESYYMQGDFRQAVREYGKVIDGHSSGDRVASALYKLGLSKLQLGERAEAVDYLRQVYERYPDSEEARLSRDKLDTLN